ncbi:MAG: hypothetical protein AB1403_17690 [Candidatus Riflebacteria bacterium]
MRSKKRPSKTRVLIVPAKGIASAMLNELAMLFYHAGSDVFFAISDETAAWFTPEQAAAYTGNQPFTSADRPAWLKSKHPFEIAVVFPDFFSTPGSFASELAARSLQIDILTTEAHFPINHTDCQTRWWHLPAESTSLQSFYQQLFSRLMRRLAGKAQTEKNRVFFSEKLRSKDSDLREKSTNFSIADQLYLAMFDAGFSFSENLAESDIVFGLTEEFSFSDKFLVEVAENQAQLLSTGFNSSRHLRILADHENITVRATGNVRVLPSIGQQNCYNRFADLILFKTSDSSESFQR